MRSMNSRSMAPSSAGRFRTKPSGEKEEVELAAEGCKLPRKLPCPCDWRVLEGASCGISDDESSVMAGNDELKLLCIE